MSRQPNISYTLTGTTAGGAAEDYATLYVGDVGEPGVLLILVAKRDVDQAISIPDGLCEADFVPVGSPGPMNIPVNDVAGFQKLVNDHLGVNVIDIAKWFHH